MNRNIALIYCNHNLFTVYFCTFLCNPSCFTTRYSLDLLQSFLTDELMDEGIWAVQDDIVDKRACIVWSSYSSSICLLVVFFLLCNFCCFSLLFSLSSLFILLLPLLLWTVGCGSEGHWFVPCMYREKKLKPLARYVVDDNIDADITILLRIQRARIIRKKHRETATLCISVFVKNMCHCVGYQLTNPMNLSSNIFQVHLRELPTVGEQLCDGMDCFGWCRWRNRSCCSVLKLLYFQGLQYGSMGCWLVGYHNTMISMIPVAMLQKLITNGGKLARWAYIILFQYFIIHHEWQWFVIQTCCFPNWMYRNGFTFSGWPPNLTLIIDAYLIKHCLNLTWLSWFMIDWFIFHMLNLFNVAIFP